MWDYFGVSKYCELFLIKSIVPFFLSSIMFIQLNKINKKELHIIFKEKDYALIVQNNFMLSSNHQSSYMISLLVFILLVHDY